MKLVALALLVVSCSSHDPRKPPAEERQPRVLDPAPQGVRALPPHAIHPDGVGPYRLGVSIEQLGNQVPSGGRNAQLEIPNVVHASVLHAEDDAIQIGGEPFGRASFVSVLRGDIARTESGVHVGSRRDELVRALGAPLAELDRARDPRLVVPANLRELRAIVEADRITGMVIAATEPAAKEPDGGCMRPLVDPNDDTMRTPRARFGACITGGPDVVTLDGDELSIRPVDAAKSIAVPSIPNIVWAAPVRTPDGRDELVAIARTDEAQARTWTLYAFRFDGTRLVRVVEAQPVYQLTAANVRWIGSELRDLDLFLEVTSRAESIEVGGLLTTRGRDRLRDLLVLSTVQVPRRRAKSASPEGGDAGIPDAGESRNGHDHGESAPP